MQDGFLVRHARTITIVSILGIVFCAILIITAFLINYFARKTYLTLQFAPSTAILQLTSQPDTSAPTTLTTGTYELTPGTYTGTLTADGFDSKSVTIDVKARQVNSYSNYLLNPEGLTYFERSAADIATLRSITGDPAVTEFLTTYDHKISFYDQLPLSISWLKRPNDTPVYNLKITNGTDYYKCTSTLCLLTTGPKENRDELSRALSERGYDINDYEVFYEYNAL